MAWRTRFALAYDILASRLAGGQCAQPYKLLDHAVQARRTCCTTDVCKCASRSRLNKPGLLLRAVIQHTDCQDHLAQLTCRVSTLLYKLAAFIGL